MSRAWPARYRLRALELRAMGHGEKMISKLMARDGEAPTENTIRGWIRPKPRKTWRRLQFKIPAELAQAPDSTLVFLADLAAVNGIKQNALRMRAQRGLMPELTREMVRLRDRYCEISGWRLGDLRAHPNAEPLS